MPKGMLLMAACQPRDGRIPKNTLGYYHFAADHQIWLMTLYSKNEAADLTAEEKKALKTAIEGEGKARETARRKR
ncbi:MAG TPA: hypothetical protein VN879_18605 [Candidatus Acidoferrales bacterium]|nr:hypothetical protein [Candidatus Acidoferrales bacterium]